MRPIREGMRAGAVLVAVLPGNAAIVGRKNPSPCRGNFGAGKKENRRSYAPLSIQRDSLRRSPLNGPLISERPLNVVVRYLVLPVSFIFFP